MNLIKEQIAAAINAGTSLTDPESDLLEVFRKHAEGILILRQLLIAIGSGQLSIGQALQDDGPTPPKPPNPPAPGNKGPAAKKGARKKRSPNKKQASSKKK